MTRESSLFVLLSSEAGSPDTRLPLLLSWNAHRFSNLLSNVK